ncbi:short chain dehydrogenase [Rhizoctonia solani]|uniref:Short chain dehydrogenase n=1 Tax=Rhizoctonia solani TaxID=456999 RepID=A0A8H8NNW5_9AGAM|nr:short chain dehydrogenase [Rhizoctonia solani]QRW16735.1 short chain dehydrogenase [Rhizoctonia solani]
MSDLEGAIPPTQRNGDDGPGKESKILVALVETLWNAVSLLTLGFPKKYQERLRLFENIYPMTEDYEPWSKPATHSDRGSEHSSLKSMRQKQQMSVITATSAAALSIQSISNTFRIYWLVTAFYSIAFGLSLEGLILITYMTISAGGSSDEAIARLAQGTLIPGPKVVKPAAFLMSLPAVMATYSSLFLLIGLITMVLVRPGESVDTQATSYALVTMIPVGLGGLFLVIAITLCEIGSQIETSGRRNAEASMNESCRVHEHTQPALLCPKCPPGAQRPCLDKAIVQALNRILSNPPVQDHTG